MNPSRLIFARAVLHYGSFQLEPAYEQCLVAVFTAEGSQAKFNPGDTTLHYPGATPYNSFGPGKEFHVWNYLSGLDGVHCTVATMQQPNMHAWYSAMRTPNKTALELCRAFSQSPWAGVGDLLPLELVQEWNGKGRDYVADRKVIVAGNGPWPFDDNGVQHRLD